MKIKYLSFLIPFLVMLTGCNYLEAANKEKKARIEKLITNTEVIDLGVVDGCSVKKHYKLTPREDITEEDKDNYNYYEAHSFYIAKCDGQPTTTTTQQVGGKQKHDEALIKVDKK